MTCACRWDVRGDHDHHEGGAATSSDKSKWVPVTSIDLNGFPAIRMLISDDDRRTVHFVSETGQLGAGSWLPRSNV